MKLASFEGRFGRMEVRRASAVSASEALKHVAGYTCVNEVSGRDLQFRSSQWMLGKAVDTFLPCGPWLVTPDEITDRQGLGIRCLVNGEVMQDSSTGRMIFGVGMSRVPPRWLRDGDEVTVEIERIGALTNQVRAAARNGGTR